MTKQVNKCEKRIRFQLAVRANQERSRRSGRAPPDGVSFKLRLEGGEGAGSVIRAGTCSRPKEECP